MIKDWLELIGIVVIFLLGVAAIVAVIMLVVKAFGVTPCL